MKITIYGWSTRAIGDRMMQVGLRLQGEVAALAPRHRRHEMPQASAGLHGT